MFSVVGAERVQVSKNFGYAIRWNYIGVEVWVHKSNIVAPGPHSVLQRGFRDLRFCNISDGLWCMRLYQRLERS